MPTFRGLLARFKTSRQNTLAIFLAVSLAVVYFWHLGTLTNGLSPAEARTRDLSHSLHLLYKNPLNAPHNILLYGLQRMDHNGAFAIRSVSVIFALIFIVCFYRIARSWFGTFIGSLGTILFAATPLLILVGRSATADIMYLTPLAVMAVYFWLSRTKGLSKIAYLCLIFVCALALYTPGVVWLLVAGAIAIRSNIRKMVKISSAWINILGFLIFFATLTPLVLAFINQPSLLKSWALLPGHLPKIVAGLQSIGWMILAVFWQSNNHSNFQISKLPLLNLADIILLVFGLYAFWSRARNKVYGLLAVVVIGAIGAGLNDRFSLLLFVLPVAIMLATAGLRYLYMEWQGVFPLNPLPRTLAILLMCAIVAIGVVFGVRCSLIAWPHTVATRDVYVLK